MLKSMVSLDETCLDRHRDISNKNVAKDIKETLKRMSLIISLIHLLNM